MWGVCGFAAPAGSSGGDGPAGPRNPVRRAPCGGRRLALCSGSLGTRAFASRAAIGGPGTALTSQHTDCQDRCNYAASGSTAVPSDWSPQ
jgi:hypothetical protein